MRFSIISILAAFPPWVHDRSQPALWTVPWLDWRGFWQQYILDDRFIGTYFLAAVPFLLLLPPRYLRHGLAVSGVLFLLYVFGALYVPVWLVMCAVFYLLTELFDREVRRRDAPRWGPPVAAVLILSIWYVATLRIYTFRLPAELNHYLFHHCPWLFPLGFRNLPWEYFSFYLTGDFAQNPPQLFQVLFILPQINGLVIFVIRMISYFGDLKRGLIPRERRSFLNFLVFATYGPALAQGPIERFTEFHDEIATCHQRRSLRRAAYGAGRILLGLAKSVFCTVYLLPILVPLMLEQDYYHHPERVDSMWLLLFGVHLNVLALYLEFSGCSDVAIGISHILGYRMIENFRRPWLATSIRDLWRRWHISFSFILRDYIYIPLGGGRRHAARNVFITFTLCALLHNLNPNFLLWGILMSLLVLAHRGWDDWMKRLDSRPTGRLPAARRAFLRLRPLPQFCAWLLTMNAFVLSLIVVPAGLDCWRVPWEILRRFSAWISAGGGP